MCKSGNGALFLGPLENRIGILREDLLTFLKTQNNQVAPYCFLLESHTFRVVMPLCIPMQDALRGGSWMVLAVNERPISGSLADFTVTDISQNRDDCQVVGLHALQKFFRSEHLCCIIPATANAPMHMR